MEFHYIDTDSFIFSFKPIEGFLEDLKYFKLVFDFNDSDLSVGLYSIVIGKVVGKLKLETPPDIDLDEATFLRSKSYSFNIKQIISHCKHKKLQDHKYTLEDYKECSEVRKT